MPELAFFRHGEELLRLALADRATVGRSAECDVALPDPTLSRVHVELRREGDGYALVDRSGRGTRVGREVVREVALADGDEIALGAWRALFRVAPAEVVEPTRVAASRATTVRPPAEPPRGPARLRVREGGRERTVAIRDGVTVGTDPSCDVALSDPFVSAHHLRLELRADGWHLRDLCSTNGTLLGGLRVAEAALPPGAPITLGDVTLALEVGEAPRAASSAAPFEGMVSVDPAMRQVFELIERVAPARVPVAILGETGCGKELVARALHALSPRRDAPFVPVNCSAIAETLIESELFGHERGAFSGAERLRKGAFEEADGGTLFLDEIGELPLDLQPKLLRALEGGEVKRVGASRPFTVDVRVVAATHRDLKAQVRSGKFREDLYYRLCVVPVTIPPLRARPADVRVLAEHLLAQAAPRGLPLRFSAIALEKLQRHPWPGNVRQLRNVVQRALLFRGEGLEIGDEAVSFDDAPGSRAADDDLLDLRGLTMEDLEREAIRLSLRRHQGKRSAVVKELGLAKSTVMKRIAQWGLQLEGRAGPLAADGEDEEDAT